MVVRCHNGFVDAIDRAREIIAQGSRITVLTGAGISTDAGIPDFRGPQGVWTKNPKAERMSTLSAYIGDREVRELAWQSRMRSPVWEAQPTRGHHALVELERVGVLRCLVTQNIDGLHGRAGQRELAEIHGNARLVRCIECLSRWPREEIPTETLPPLCGRCGGILKADTVSFGEPIPADVLRRSLQEAERADCIVVAGTSATVYPAASLPHSVLGRRGVVIEVNPHASELSELATFALRGPAGEILPRLVQAVKARQR